MEKQIHFKAAYSKRHPDPKKDYGTHGVDMWFALTGKSGGVVFVLFTGWNPYVPADQQQPNPACIEWHSRTEREWYDRREERCNALNQDGCWSKSVYCLSDEVFDILEREGEDAFWAKMKQLYDDEFGED